MQPRTRARVAPPPAVGSAPGVGSLDREALRRVGAAAVGVQQLASPAMVTLLVLLRQAPGARAARLLLRPSATARTTPRDRSVTGGISQLSWPDAAAERCPTLQATSWRPWIDPRRACGHAPTRVHLRCCADGAAPLAGPVVPGGWAVGADASTRPRVAPSLSFWCSPLPVRGAPHQPREPNRPAANGHWPDQLLAAATSIGFLGDGPGSGVHQVISSSHAWPSVAKGPAPGHHLSRKAMAVACPAACAAPGV